MGRDEGVTEAEAMAQQGGLSQGWCSSSSPLVLGWRMPSSQWDGAARRLSEQWDVACLG